LVFRTVVLQKAFRSFNDISECLYLVRKALYLGRSRAGVPGKTIGDLSNRPGRPTELDDCCQTAYNDKWIHETQVILKFRFG